MRITGIGLCGAERFCAFMDLPRPMFQSFYDRVVEQIRNTARICCDLVMKKAVKEEVQETSNRSDFGSSFGISVSGDGSWKKRGFKSLFGISSLIGYFTGKIVDVIVKSNFCKLCAQMEPKKGTIEYDFFMQDHSLDCSKNHETSSSQMESDGIKEMFLRSKTLHSVQYTNYIGDGDTKTYKNICDAKPYGDRTIIKKNV
ncbi:GSCOCG00011666001-RA-CDS [Cotesia congregata]|nr:GSCOCG00011513001-RA-CDS [Cotesia congregata]CAD6221957.1 GSCOCG00011666001-RA-CDS [Cotesia congregata]